MRCEHQSVVVCESFGLVSRLMLVCSPALLEAEALSVHLQDMDMVSKAGPERAGQAFRSKDLGPLVEGQVGGDQSSAPLVALTEDLEQQFRPGLGQGYEAQFIDDQQFQAGQPLLQLHSVSS